GGDAAALGPALHDPVTLAWPAAERHGPSLHGECIAADPFGNVVTSVRAADLAALGDSPKVIVAGRPARLVRTFGEGLPGELVVREGSAAARHGLVRGTPVVVEAR